jgi:hypothetical protein
MVSGRFRLLQGDLQTLDNVEKPVPPAEAATSALQIHVSSFPAVVP